MSIAARARRMHAATIMNTRPTLPALSLLLCLACASGGASRPANVAAPDVAVELRTPLFFGATRESPVTLDVNVTNRATVPLQARRVRVTSPGMVQYVLRPRERYLREDIAPGETKTILVDGVAVASRAGLAPSEPLNVRVEIEFEGGGRRFREIYDRMNVVP